MAALRWVDSALTIAVGIAGLLRLQFNSWLIAPEPYLDTKNKDFITFTSYKRNKATYR